MLLCLLSPMDFAQPVSFENADIGQCPTLEPEARPPEEEGEDGGTRSTVLIQPEPDTKRKTESTTIHPTFSSSPPPPPTPPLPPALVSVYCFSKKPC